MKALVYEGPREMNIREVEPPTARSGEVLIEVAYSGICGSELSGFLSQSSLRKPPCVFGHEFAGKIGEIGPEVSPELWVAPRGIGQRPIRWSPVARAAIAGPAKSNCAPAASSWGRRCRAAMPAM